MKKYLTSIVFFFIIVGTGLLAWHYFYQTSSVVYKRYLTVIPSTFTQEVTIPGTVAPIRQTLITASYSGYIKKLYVKIGQVVKKGDPIVSIVESLQTDEKVYPMRAPYDGTVVTINNTEGEFVRAGDTANPIAEIDDLSRFYIIASISELDLPKLKLGQKAEIKIMPITSKTYQGVVNSIAMAPKIQSGNYTYSYTGYPIKIEILDQDNQLKPGMSSVAKIITNKQKAILAVPHEFILKSGSKNYVITKDGKHIPVVVGAQTNDKIHIKEGIAPHTVIQQINYFSKPDKN